MKPIVTDLLNRIRSFRDTSPEKFRAVVTAEQNLLYARQALAEAEERLLNARNALLDYQGPDNPITGQNEKIRNAQLDRETDEERQAVIQAETSVRQREFELVAAKSDLSGYRFSFSVVQSEAALLIAALTNDEVPGIEE